MSTKDHFPTLGIKEFQPDPQSGYDFQYHQLLGKRSIEKPHKHDFFVLLLFGKGSGIHSIDFNDYTVADHQVHLLFPGQVHRWELGADTEADQLMISRPLFETLSDSLSFSLVLYQHHPVINLNKETFQKFRYEFQSIRDELNIRPVQWNIVHLRSRIIAQLITREAENKFEDMMVYRAKPLLLKYHALVEHHFKEQKSVSFYAAQLHISANYLNILCKKHLHVPAMFLIQTRTVLEAKRLLQASASSIKEIAFELGFQDGAYFSNFFKSQAGVSPTAFREQL